MKTEYCGHCGQKLPTTPMEGRWMEARVRGNDNLQLVQTGSSEFMLCAIGERNRFNESILKPKRSAAVTIQELEETWPNTDFYFLE